VCLWRRRGDDQGGGRRRWRHLDAGLLQVWLEADAPRVFWPQHAVVVAHALWARPDAGHTRAFDDTVAWLATAAAKSTVCSLLRIAWRTVGSIVTRVADEAMAARDRCAGLSRIGIVRSRSSAVIATSPSQWIMIVGGWCGPRRGGTRPL